MKSYEKMIKNDWTYIKRKKNYKQRRKRKQANRTLIVENVKKIVWRCNNTLVITNILSYIFLFIRKRKTWTQSN